MQRILRQALNACLIGSSLTLSVATASWAEYGGVAIDRNGMPVVSVVNPTAESAQKSVMALCRNRSSVGGCRFEGTFQNSYFVIVKTSVSGIFVGGLGQTVEEAYNSAQSRCRPVNTFNSINGTPLLAGACQWNTTVHSNSYRSAQAQ